MNKYQKIFNDLYLFYFCFVVQLFNNEVLAASHIKKISRELMRMYLGEYKKLSVSLPPRHSKSSLITLAFPLWLIIRDPTLNIMIVTSTFNLSESFGIRIRELFLQYADILPIKISNKKHASGWIMFEDREGNLTGGSIRLVGLGGQITGFDADWVIVDDIVKGIQDCTPTQLQKTRDFFDGVLLQRLEPHSKIIVLGTLWSSEDILSIIRKERSDEYHILDLPAYNKNGEVLWPEKYDLNYFNEKENEMGERLFQALYMCKPLDETGEYFDVTRLQFIDNTRDYAITSKVRSYDCAYSDESKGETNDRTASVLMYRTIDDKYIIKQLDAGRYGDNLFNVIKSTARIDTPNIPILIETGTVGGSSKALYDVYKKNLPGYNVRQSKPLTSKVDRAFAFKEAILDGKVLVCLNDEARENLLTEMKGFPLMKRDDIIDACSYAFNYLSEHHSIQVKTGGTRRRRRIR